MKDCNKMHQQNKHAEKSLYRKFFFWENSSQSSYDQTKANSCSTHTDIDIQSLHYKPNLNIIIFIFYVHFAKILHEFKNEAPRKKNINLVTFFKVYEEISKEFNISAHKQTKKSELNGCLSIQRFIMLFGE